MPKAAIFDVDGTLVDSVDQHAKAWHAAFHEFGHDIPIVAIRNQIGKGGDQLMPVFLKPQELQAQAAGIDKFRARIMKERYRKTVTAFANVRALFERLRHDGIRVVLASSAKAEDLSFYKDLADIADLVDAETSSDDADKSKPHPDIFRAALERISDVTPADAVVIGDSPYDAEAAARAGIRTIGVLSGGFSETVLRRAGCVAIFADVADLLINYGRSPLAANGSEPAA